MICHVGKPQNLSALICIATCPSPNGQVCLLKKGKRIADSFSPLHVHIPQKPSNPVVGILPLNVLNTGVTPRTP